MHTYHILKIEHFEGEYCTVECRNGGKDFVFCVVAIDEVGRAEIVDNGYRSHEEALRAWSTDMPAAIDGPNGA